MENRILHVYKAKRTGPEIPDAQLLIHGEIPDSKHLTILAEHFQYDGEAVEALLHDTLPGGTYDRVLIAMLERKATSFVVPL